MSKTTVLIYSSTHWDREWYEPYWVSDQDLLKALGQPVARQAAFLQALEDECTDVHASTVRRTP